MKKFITLLLVLTGMVLSISATDYYVIGDVAGGWVGNPITAGKALAMTQVSSNTNLYYCDITPTGNDKYFVIVDGEGSSADDWTTLATHKFGNDTQEVGSFTYGVGLTKGKDKAFYVSTADGTKSFRVVFNSSAKTMDVVEKGLTRTVAGSFTPDGGVEEASFLTSAWTPSETKNKLTIQEDGSYAITYSNKSLAAGTITFKLTDGTWSYATSTNQTKTLHKALTYTITFTMPYANNYNSYTCKAIEPTFNGYYLVSSEDSWTAGDALSASGSVYSKTFLGKTSCEFIITPNTNVDAGYNIIDWDDCIRPAADKEIVFRNYAAEAPCAETGKSYKWTVNNHNAPDVTFSYDKTANKWSVVAEDASCTITSAGFATYSMGDKFKVSGATGVYTISANNTTSVTMQEWDASTVFAANTGVIIEGTASATIEAVDAATATTDLGTNYLKGSGNNPDFYLYANTGIYIFNWDGSNASSIGFYLANDGQLGAHKAYLDLANTPAHDFLSFDFNDTTDIQVVKKNNNANAEFFNLAGQRVAQPTKGMYIVNGKKVIIK